MGTETFSRFRQCRPSLYLDFLPYELDGSASSLADSSFLLMTAVALSLESALLVAPVSANLAMKAIPVLTPQRTSLLSLLSLLKLPTVLIRWLLTGLFFRSSH